MKIKSYIDSFRNEGLRFYIPCRLEELDEESGRRVIFSLMAVEEGKIRFSQKKDCPRICIINEYASPEINKKFQTALDRLTGYLQLDIFEGIGLMTTAILSMLQIPLRKNEMRISYKVGKKDEAHGKLSFVGPDTPIFDLESFLKLWEIVEPKISTFIQLALPDKKKGKSFPTYKMFPPEFLEPQDMEKYQMKTEGLKVGLNIFGEYQKIDLAKDGRGAHWKEIEENVERVIEKVILL